MGAAAAYIGAAERLNTSEHWMFGLTHYQRGIFLSGKFGRGKELFVKAVTSLTTAARQASTEPDSFQCCRLMDLMLQTGVGDPEEFAAAASSLATVASAKGDL